MAHHEQNGATDEWYTPSYIFEALAFSFDMDVAYPARNIGTYRPVVPATKVLSERSLETPWSGYVWMNPPFGGRNGIAPWLDKFFEHGDGVALMPDRTSAPWWQGAARQADCLLFVAKKIRFFRSDGTRGVSPSTGTCLMAKGEKDVLSLKMAEAAGLGLTLRPSCA